MTPEQREARRSSLGASEIAAIQVGDLVEVVSMKGGDTVLPDVGKGGVVSYVYDYGAVRLKKHPQYNLPLARMASIVDCRKVAAHARPVTP